MGVKKKRKSISGGSPPRARSLLLVRDQAVVGFTVLSALLSMCVYWVAQGGLTGGLIEIDRAESLSAKFLVDINQAEWPELAVLPEIGPTLAQRIVESRQTAGPFVDHEDLRRVRGIGPLTLERLRPYLLPMPYRGDVAGTSNDRSGAL
jgi:competence protein ComEA